jgi:sugar lactone lactonase YvrE
LERRSSSEPTAAPDAEDEMRTLLTGLLFGESARWHDGRLWLCDWGSGEVLAVDGDGRRQVVAEVGSYPLCIDWLPDGRLLVVAGGDSRVLRREDDGRLVTHADLGGLSTERWNEIAVHPSGTAFVNGGPGAVAAVAPDGSVRPAADGLAFPNGMAVTPDGSVLLVAESHAGRITAFSVGDDGTLGDRRVWAEVTGSAPDGICLDPTGAVWYADVPNRCCALVAEGGAVLRRVDADRGCFSCALGGSTLFIAATEWRGFDGMFAGPPTGQVLAVDVA